MPQNPDVLVVGAGPVGMTAALFLAEQDVRAAVIDAEGGTAARSYACALHPQSLELLDHFGLAEEIIASGRRIDRFAFYEGLSKRAEIKLSELNSKFPFIVVLPQRALEGLLERALARRAGIQVLWHHRLSDLKSGPEGVTATVDTLRGTSLGYIVPHWEVIVQKTSEINVPFLVGTDGHNSLVRRCLGIGYEQAGVPELYLVFEFETDANLDGEVRVVLDETTTNVLWPLPGAHCRWGFQVTSKAPPEEFPEKDRKSVWVEDPESDRRIRQRLSKLIQERAPWFSGQFREFGWVSHVQFEHRVVERFSNGQCWLVGDAAHQTGPVGVQSLNVGLREAKDLAGALKNLVKGGAASNLAVEWDRRWRQEWRQLLGTKGALKKAGNTDEWVLRRAARILPCIPAFGDDLAKCVRQFQMELP